MIIERVPCNYWPGPPPTPADRIAEYEPRRDATSAWHRGRRLAGEAIQHTIRTQGWDIAKRRFRDPRIDEASQ